MNHAFDASQLDRKVCKICKYDFAAHTRGAHCEACSFVGECEVIITSGAVRMLLCPSCKAKELDAIAAQELANSQVMERTKVLSHAQVLIEKTRELDTIEKSRQIDDSIRVRGDIWNAQTISLHELANAVNSDESLTEPEKLRKIQELTIERIEKFSKRLFKIQTIEHKMVIEQQSRIQFLRDFGQKLREDIRERIKASDTTYQPHKAPVKPIVTKKTAVSPFDRIAQALIAAAAVKGEVITMDEARKRLEKGGIS